MARCGHQPHRYPDRGVKCDNAHTNDPARWRGEVCGLEVVSDGLDAVIDATPEGGEAIRTTPGLADAPRLIER